MPAQNPSIADDHSVTSLENKKNSFQMVLDLLLAFRLSAHTSGVASASSASSSKEVAFNSAMMELIYGSFGMALFLVAISYNCLATKNESVDKYTILKELFSGKKLQYFISYGLSLIGSCLWRSQLDLVEVNQSKHVLVAGYILLGFSGFLTGIDSTKTAAQMTQFFRNNESHSASRTLSRIANASAAHEPISDDLPPTSILSGTAITEPNFVSIAARELGSASSNASTIAPSATASHPDHEQEEEAEESIQNTKHSSATTRNIKRGTMSFIRNQMHHRLPL
jgi:hypothetical protein